MNLNDINNEIFLCDRCGEMIEKFPEAPTVSVGNSNKLLILGEAPANNGWRKSGKAFYNNQNQLVPSGVVLQRLLDLINIKLDEVYFMEAMKCFPKDRKYIKKCCQKCKDFLIQQIEIINPEIILSLGDSATRNILDYNYNNFKDVVGKEFYIDNMCIIPIYHPSPISPMSYKGNEEIIRKLVGKI